jgi:predicted Zn-ribbon and HTH transcriptional regulator
MKPTISIFEDEIVITTDSFDLILKTGAERKSVEIESEPLTEEEKNWKFKPSFDDMEKSIEEFTERYPEDVVLNKELKKVPEHIDNFLKGKTKHTRNLPAKPCKICGNDFKPTWNTQHYCPACKPKYYGQKRKPLAEQTAEELEKTLQEIENRRKKPYEFK